MRFRVKPERTKRRVWRFLLWPVTSYNFKRGIDERRWLEWALLYQHWCGGHESGCHWRTTGFWNP